MKKKHIIITAVLCAVCIAIGAIAAVIIVGNKSTPSTSTNVSNGEISPSNKDQYNTVNPGKDDKSQFIGEEKAKEIVLQKAGLKADEVRFDRVELDKDNGVWYYEIEFNHGYKEYSADVNALDGSVRDYEIDIDD